LTLDELAPYAKLYDDIINGKVDANKHRHDLGSHVERKDGKAENICQAKIYIKDGNILNKYVVRSCGPHSTFKVILEAPFCTKE